VRDAAGTSVLQHGVHSDSGEQARRLLEEQNDEQISHLSLQISQLKSVRGAAINSSFGSSPS
jgi:hypothetical protein